ncbi:E3 SUMO-protein ligase ZBED1-like [Brevipalpus obovatus]|uniref:E3 SUMO-protein ligase ZBED1-like n=1 Tax=Brevipalpus obovatus TaxID=246614 RepID=UPI003D9E2380
MSRKKESQAWKHFSKSSQDQAKCNLCGGIFSSKNVTNLTKHLNKKHPFVISSLENDNNEQQKESQQVDLSSFFKRSKRTSLFGTIKKSILRFIIKDNLPASIVNGEGFRAMMKDFFHELPTIDRKTIRTQIDEMFKFLKPIKAKSFHGKEIALSCDLWTEQFNHINYISLTGHFIGDDGNMTRVTLVCDPFESASTGEEIARTLSEILDDWNIKKEDVMCLVTDGAGNMRVASEILLGKSKHFICYAHRLNNAAQSAFKYTPEVNQILMKVKAIVQFSNQSNNFFNILRSVQMNDDLDGGKALKLIQSVETSLAIIKHPKDPPPQVSRLEKEVLIDLMKILEPLSIVTNEMSGDIYPTLSKVIPITYGLKKAINVIQVHSQVGQKFQDRLSFELNERLGNPESTLMCAVATFLDPRFKIADFSNPRSVLAAKNYIQKMNPDSTVTTIVPSQPSKGNLIWSYHDDIVSQVAHGIVNTSDFEIAYRQWIESRLLERQDDVLEFWRNQEGLFKNISLQFLIIPATSVPCERLFSDAGNTVTYKRSYVLKTLMIASCSNIYQEKTLISIYLIDIENSERYIYRYGMPPICPPLPASRIDILTDMLNIIYSSSLRGQGSTIARMITFNY